VVRGNNTEEVNVQNLTAASLWHGFPAKSDERFRDAPGPEAEISGVKEGALFHAPFDGDFTPGSTCPWSFPNVSVLLHKFVDFGV
jgi:hypothetical protein